MSQKAIYRGKNVRLMKPRRLRPGDTSFGRKKFEVFVLDNNRVKRVSFLARHRCNTANDPTTPRYWSCQEWL